MYGGYIDKNTNKYIPIQLHEMANLDKDDLGFPGYLYISTIEGNHKHPRIKYYRNRPDKQDLFVSIEVSEHFPILNDNINVTDKEYKNIIDFINKGNNKEKIIKFWYEGMYWTKKEVQTLLNSLESI